MNTINCSLARYIQNISLRDLEAVKLILSGHSVVDWAKLDLYNYDDVDQFLALHAMDLKDSADQDRLRFLFNQSINYLEENLDLNFPEEMRNPVDIRDIFVLASDYGGFRRKQILACVILKLMHVINHMEAADLKFQSRISEAMLIEMAERKIIGSAEKMRKEGLPIVAFYGSKKTRTSVITKLLAKTQAHATTIFDKLRFRVVTKTKEDILPSLVWLTRNVFPFNYVIPRESHNNLMTLTEMVCKNEHLLNLAGQMSQPLKGEDEPLTQEPNPFSGSSYRMINFIVDYPIKIDPSTNLDPKHQFLLGRVVYVMVEFQIVDQATALSNQQGENAHSAYKKRQKAIVDQRLKRGRTHRLS